MRVDASPELGHDRAVHGDTACDDELLRDTTGCDTGGRHHLLQALALTGRAARPDAPPPCPAEPPPDGALSADIAVEPVHAVGEQR